MSRPIDVVIDVRSEQGMTSLNQLGNAVKGVGIAMIAAGIDAGIEAIGNSIELASDKAEAASKVNVIFADSADAIHEAAGRAAETVGLSSGQYLTAAGNLGNLLKNFDLTTDAAAAMSEDMIQLAADLGSFNNADPTEVVEAMGAAMRGESEPMRRFGVLIDEAAIKSKALELGLDASKDAVDKSGRAQAIYALMLEQSTDAAGDFARTSDGLANQQRINAAKMEDAWTRIGDRLMPIAQTIMPMVADALLGIVDGIGWVMDAVAEWVDDNQELVDSLIDIARVIFDTVVRAFQIFIDVVGELGYRLGGLIGLIIDILGAIIDLGDAIIRVLKGDFEGAAEAGGRAMERIGSFAENVQRVIGDAGRRAADEAENMAAATAEAQAEIYEATHQQIVNSSVGFVTAVGEAGAESAAALTSSTAAALDRGTPAVDAAAARLADVIPEALTEAQQEAVRIAGLTPGEMASELRGRRDDWRSALDQLKDDMKNSMDATKEIAQLEAALAGKKLAQGLESTDPIVRAQAQATVDLINARLDDLANVGLEAGESAGEALARGLRNRFGSVSTAANQLAGIVRGRLELNSPAKAGPWSERGGPMEWAREAGEKIVGALDGGLHSRDVRPPEMRLEGIGVSSGPVYGSGAPPIYIQVGVGDPVAIGREVDLVLRAYYRSSGTE